MKTKSDECPWFRQAAAILGLAPNTIRKWGRGEDSGVSPLGQHLPTLRAV